MTHAEALKLALSKEEGAIKLYRRLAAEHTVIKDLFFSLLNEEEKHKKMIEEKLAKLT